MSGRNVANVSWGDHVEWGEGSSRLATAEDIARSVERWVTRDGARRIHFREHEYYRRYGRIVNGTWRSDLFESAPACDENDEILRRGHEAGIPVWLYVTVYDDLWLDTQWQWPWDPGTNWLGDYVRDHPQDVLVDRDGNERLWGVLDYNSDPARAYRVDVIQSLLGDRDWDGVFVCTRSQSRPAAHGDQFGYNEPSVDLYRRRLGADPRDERVDVDMDAWRHIRGEGLTRLLRDLRAMTWERGIGLGVGIPRAESMGPPIGNLALDWRRWADERLIDALVVGQISEICPSAWVHLWPEVEVEGYLADPVRGTGMRPLAEDLDARFGPACAAAGVELYLSRLHDHPHPEIEARLVDEHPLLTGIQYSTFRRDLGDAAAEMPWRRTLRWPEGRNAWDPERGLVRAEPP